MPVVLKVRDSHHGASGKQRAIDLVPPHACISLGDALTTELIKREIYNSMAPSRTSKLGTARGVFDFSVTRGKYTRWSHTHQRCCHLVHTEHRQDNKGLCNIAGNQITDDQRDPETTELDLLPPALYIDIMASPYNSKIGHTYGHLTLIFTLFCGATGQLTWVPLHNSTWYSSLNNTTNITLYPPGRRDAVLSYDAKNNQLILFGGSPGPLSDTWMYNIITGEWRQLNTSVGPQPPARYGALGGVSGDYFYIATGRGFNNTLYNDVWRLDLRTEKWNMLPPAPLQTQADDPDFSQPYAPSGRYFASGGIYPSGTRLYVSMGSMDQTSTDFTFAYDVISNVWYKEAGGCSEYDPDCPHARYIHGGVMTDRENFVIFSGCLSSEKTAGPCPSHDTWHYDGQKQTWSQLENCPVPRLHSTMALLPDDRGKNYVVLYGGQTNSRFLFTIDDLAADQVAVLDLQSGSWTQYETSPQNNESDVPLRRLSAAMATGSDGVYLFGGVSLHGVHLNDLWLLRGNSSDADLSPSLPCAAVTISMITVHGILMSIAFGVLLPLGALLLRHFRCLYTHIVFQTLGLCSAIGGLALGVISVGTSHFSFVHAIVGIIALGLGMLQPLNAFLRPSKSPQEERKTAALALWQFVHRFGGRVAILLGLANGSLGIFLAVASLPIIISWHAWIGFLLLLCLLGEIVRRCCRKRGRGNDQLSLMLGARGKTEGDGIINGWGKDSNYVNPTTESVRL